MNRVIDESILMAIDTQVPNVDIAKKQWAAYQELCNAILDDSDYQKIIVKEKDPETGKYVKVEREFKKKSAWQKLARAFNVDTKIVEKEFQRTKTGRIKEAYYCVCATLPNGRSVESDALCNRSEKGKSEVSDHTIMSIAKTRATNRAIGELIGAGEVSSDEMTAEYRALDDPDHHYIAANSVTKTETQTPKNEVPEDSFVTAAEVGEPRIEDDPVHNTCMEIKKMLEREGKLVTKQTMKAKVIRLVQEEHLPPENKPVLIDYINKHCPEALEGGK